MPGPAGRRRRRRDVRPPAGALQLLASSAEQINLLELFELEADIGPCLTAYRTGRPTHFIAPGPGDPLWEPLISRAARAGYHAVHAIPLHLRDHTAGVLNLFSHAPLALSRPNHDLARALADVTTIALLQRHALVREVTLNGQLQTALDSRVHIEQAKGIIATRQGITTDAAFEILRARARATNQKIADLARGITDTTTDPPPSGQDSN
ncbi:GAF and ANTAR domain-containing protein [Actinomadura fulvescens]|uniref:ANTAR domain-containing protein n=1 Tax=Actinomadura fulvescens TaxID=46160 RepID=A0ABN3PXN9_9ACTN